MALTIIAECIDCGACEPACPNGAIYEGDGIYVINPDHCTECYGFYTTQQCAAVCPVESCLIDLDHPETPEMLDKKFRILYPGKIPVQVTHWTAPE